MPWFSPSLPASRWFISAALICWGGVGLPSRSMAEDGRGAGPAPGRTRERISVQRNQPYTTRSDRSGLCDIYLPGVSPSPAGHPVVVVVHGGAWISGDKGMVEGYARSLAQRGFATLTMNYRLAPAHPFPAQVDDLRETLLYVTKIARQRSLDTTRIGMFGYSAGGHLVALVASLADEPIDVRVSASRWPAADPRWQRLPSLRAVCVGGTPCDFRVLPIDNTTLSYFLGGSRRDKPEVYLAASPTAHVSADDPVTQIIHGDRDLLVPIAGSQKFHAAQLAAGVDSRLEIMSGQGHMMTFLNPKTQTKVVEFFAKSLPGP